MRTGWVTTIIGSILLATDGAGAAAVYYVKDTLQSPPAQAAGLTPQQLSTVPGRLKDQKAQFLKGAVLGWDIRPDPGEMFVEFWLKPEAWNALTAEAVTLARFVGGGDCEVRKIAGGSEIQLLQGGVPVQSYPIYSWVPTPGLDPWHYVNVGFTHAGVRLTVDGFAARDLGRSAVAGPVQRVELHGGPGTVFAWLHVVGTAWLKPEELRARYRNLYRGQPDLRRNTITVPWLVAPPKLDGTLSAPEWDRAARLTGFISLKNKTVREEDLSLCFGYDERYLYMAVRTPYKGELRARQHKIHDMPLWGEESYEIFLHPPFTGVPDFCQLVGNPYGDQADLKMLNLAWNGKWDWRTSVTESEWTAEFRADFKGIDTPPPGKSATWTMNLVSTYADAAWCWVRAYNDSASFGTLRFDATAPVIRPGRYQVSAAQVKVPMEILGGGRKTQLTAGLHLYGTGDVLPRQETVRSVNIAPGGCDTFDLAISTDGLADGTVVLFVREGETDLFQQTVGFPPAPMRERTGYPEEKPSAVKSGATAAADTAAAELTPEQKAYQRTWSAAELGATLVEGMTWQNNRLGCADDVPRPWTPMEVDGQTVKCWNRVYRYQDSLLPVQIASAGEELLAAPARLVIAQGRRKHVFATASVQVQKINDGLVRVTSAADSGYFRAEMSADYEFDGMARIELTLRCPDDLTEITGAWLEFPLAAERCRLFHLTSSESGHSPGSDSGAVPPDEMSLDAFREVVWLGDHERGFCWFAESLENWRLRDEQGIQVVSPERKGVRALRIKLAEKPFKPEQPWRITFGIQATPVKPRPANFRQLGDRNACAWHWFWGDGDYYPFQSVHADKAKAQIDEARKSGKEVMPCSSITFHGTYRFHLAPFGEMPDPGLMHRELMLWGPLWESTRTPVRAPTLPERHTAPDGWYGKKTQPVHENSYCAASPYQDYYIWKLADTIQKTGLGAIYLDQPMVGCSNAHHGCGYVDYRGKLVPRLPLFARRQMLKRIHRLFYDAHGKVLIRWHCSNQIVPPLVAFFDIFWDGENYFSGPHKVFEFYSKALGAERLQAQHTGAQFGFIADLLPEFEGHYAPTPASVRDMMGLFMVHDSTVWPVHTAHDRLAGLLEDRKLALPLDKMQVLHYWTTDPRLQVSPAAVKSILYWNEQQALLILFNWSDETTVADVRLDPAGLGMRGQGWMIKDLLTDEALPPTPAAFGVPLLPRDLRLLTLAPGP